MSNEPRPTHWRDDVLDRLVSDAFMRGPGLTSDYINAFATPGALKHGRFTPFPLERHKPLQNELWEHLHDMRNKAPKDSPNADQ